jgi:hypothetical protein
VNGTAGRSSEALDQPSRSIIGSHVQRTIRRKRLEERTLRLSRTTLSALACGYLPENDHGSNTTREEHPAKETFGSSGGSDTTDNDKEAGLSSPENLDSEPTEEIPTATGVESTSRALRVVRSRAQSVNHSRTGLASTTEVVEFPTLEAATVAFEHCE